METKDSVENAGYSLLSYSCVHVRLNRSYLSLGQRLANLFVLTVLYEEITNLQKTNGKN